MAAISKFNTALMSMPNELTVAAANFNIDFSLIKVEAPKEFHGVRDALSTHRRDEAEEGQPHTTARKLGALFEAIIPPIPDLIQAYGKRASFISSQSTADTQAKPINNLFAAQAGIDGTTIWAAATSGQAALAVHLLACMLARMWKSHEAISLWVELVECRKADIIDTYNNNNAIETAAIMASKQTISRQQLAQWDSSARSWLQTADTNRRVQQTQLMLILNNVGLPVNSIPDTYKSVIKAWTSAMNAMNSLVSGVPQQVQDGAILLAMSSWHLYPDMEVLANKITKVDQKDELMNGGIVTISAHRANNEKEGVFWSLPLSRMRFYSPPVVANRHISSATSRITMDELWIVVLGVIISQWNEACPDIDKCCSFIIFLSNLINKPSTTVPWLQYLSDAALRQRAAQDLERRQAERLLGLGMRQCASFLNPPSRGPPPFFGLCSFSVLKDMVPDIEAQMNLMRRISDTLNVPCQDLIIRYGRDLTKKDSVYGLATALPSSANPRSDDEPLTKRKRQHDLGEGYIRWVPSALSMPSAVCVDSNCRCVTGRGPECGCGERGLRCSLACHPSIEALSRCRYGCGSQQMRYLSCERDRNEHGCDCRVCLLRRYVSGVESTGERCYILGESDILRHDYRNFSLTIPGCKKWDYEYVLGDLHGTSLFSRKGSRVAGHRSGRSGLSATLNETEWFLSNDSVSLKNLRGYLERLQHRRFSTHGPENDYQATSLIGLEFATKLYESFKYSTINIDVVRKPLYEAAWVSYLSLPVTETSEFPLMGGQEARHTSSTMQYFSPESQTEPLHMSAYLSALYKDRVRLATHFACIAMFETGEFDIEPKSLEGVMALSTGDSIYVATALISDPSDTLAQYPLRRVMGNLGRPEMAFLIPPSSPRLQEYDLASWNLINHLPFDGEFEDSFTATSLHLSFTDFEMPLDVGIRGLRDTLVVVVESLVSINDAGKHLGDLDVMCLFTSPDLAILQECTHSREPANQSTVDNLISVDCWAEFWDLPKTTAIVRASGNWQARLAFGAASAQRKKSTLILPRNPCITCLSSRDDLHKFDIIIA